MPSQLKQAQSGAATWVDLVGPLETAAVLTPITINNRTGGSLTFRIAISPNGAAISDSHEIATDVALAANTPTQFPIGQELPRGAILRVRGSAAGLNFATTVMTPY